MYLAETIANRTVDADDEVGTLCAVARERSISGDLVNFVGLDSIEARMLGRRGRLDEALTLGRRALEAVDEMDFFEFRAKVRLGLAEVLARAGQRDEFERVGEEAVAIHTAKGDVTGAAWARRWLEALRASVA